jgi:hypothetical protein
MSDLRDVATLLTSLKTAYDLTKAFLDVQGAVKQQGKVSELLAVILAAQESAVDARQAQSELLTRIGELQRRIAELETWKSEKERYEPVEIRRA